MTEDEKRKIINETIKNILGDTEIDPNDPERHFCVYMHTNKVNGKMYIGMTGDVPEYRWNGGRGYTSQTFSHAIQKYGWDNFEHTILYEHLTKDESLLIEEALIFELQTLINQYGYNASPGMGYSSVANKKGVYQFDLYGNLLDEFDSMLSAATNISHRAENNNIAYNVINISRACNESKTHYSLGYTWFLKDNYESPDEIKKKFDWSVCDMYYPVLQFDLNGNFMFEYSSAVEAANKYGINNYGILQCCRGELKKSKNYIWAFKHNVNDINQFKNNIDNYFKRRRVEYPHILQCSLDGKIIAEFESKSEAMRKTGFGCIPCRANKPAIAYNYLWKYKDDNVIEKHIEHCTEVVALDEKYVFISWFESIREAARYLPESSTTIKNSIDNKSKTKYNHYFINYIDYINCGGYI